MSLILFRCFVDTRDSQARLMWNVVKPTFLFSRDNEERRESKAYAVIVRKRRLPPQGKLQNHQCCRVMTQAALLQWSRDAVILEIFWILHKWRWRQRDRSPRDDFKDIQQPPLWFRMQADNRPLLIEYLQNCVIALSRCWTLSYAFWYCILNVIWRLRTLAPFEWLLRLVKVPLQEASKALCGWLKDICTKNDPWSG